MIRIAIFFLALGCSLQALAHCSHDGAAKRRSRIAGAAKTAVASPLLNDYDLGHVRIDLEIDNRNTDIRGNTTSTVRVLKPGGISTYAFELHRNLTLDSMTVNGTTVSPVLSPGADLYTVSLPAAQAQGTIFRARVWYHGSTGAGTGFFTHGLNHYSLPSGTNITFTLSDPFLAKDWWPCKQTLVDKVDSAEIWLTVADSLRAGSNGVLERVSSLPGNRSRYEWKTRYPITYYLLSFSVAPYVEYRQRLQFSGSADTMPLIHYVYDTASFNPAYKPGLDSTPHIVDYFSTLFGRYPFWREKYGHCVAPLGGGMEHQTMTTLGNVAPTTLIAHELGHQWWGNHVTYASWRDIWLSEGFASYCEDLFVEHFRGKAAAHGLRTQKFNRVISAAGGAVYVDDTDDVYRVFDSRLTYDKGSAVAHMLRYWAPSDAAFFSGLRSYQQRYSFGHGTTDSLKAVMEAAYGYRLDSFFRQWVYGEGYPIYTALWNQSGSNVFVELRQTSSRPGSVPLFEARVPLRLVAQGRDTIVYAPFRTGDSLFRFTWAEPMTGLQLDPENHIVNRNGAVVEEAGVGVSLTGGAPRPYVFPNPADEAWIIRGLRSGQELEISDAGGRVVFSLKADPSGQARIDSSRLAPGMYLLRSPGDAGFAMKLQRR